VLDSQISFKCINLPKRLLSTSTSVLGALPDSLIDDIIEPSSEPVGIRLLKRMGWKSGQGIGPRVSRRQKKPEDGGHSDEDDEHLANVTFAPIDSAVVVFTNKTNHQGLGFDPYKHAPEFDRSLQARTESKYQTQEPKGKRTGFGFGKFDDDDDEDGVYGSGPSILKSLDYDPALNDRPRSRRGDNKEKEKSRIKVRGHIRCTLLDGMPKASANFPDILSPFLLSIHKHDTLVAIYCSDGRPPLAGFVLASTPAKALRWYSAPEIPKDFVPHHTFDDDVKPILPTNKREQPKLTADDVSAHG
jgi:G patch domain-containing protein 1